MKALFSWFGLIFAVSGADDAGTKVKDIKSGSEVRILKVGIKEAVVGKLDEADDFRLVLVLKNAQAAILKEDVLSIGVRPMGLAV